MAGFNINSNDEIILGSGDLYMKEFAGSGEEVPADATIETPENMAGNILGGAALEYKADTKSLQDDKGRVRKTITTKETTTFKTGLLTWRPEWIQALVATARIDTKSKPGHRLFKIGGLGNDNKKNYIFRFVHERSDGRKLRLTLTGKNTGGLKIAFDPDKETTTDAEITADALDKDGTLVIIDDEMSSAEMASSLKEAKNAESAEQVDVPVKDELSPASQDKKSEPSQSKK